MSRLATLGNGTLLVGLDEFGMVRDLYYPYCGYENHVGGHFAHKIGVWIDGRFSWLSDGAWNISIECLSDSMASTMTAKNERMAISLSFYDVVYNERDIFIRKIHVKNEGRARTIKVFFYHQFEMYESHKAHTAYFAPLSKTIIHYRNKRVFVINAQIESKGFDEYSTGVFNINGREGTFRDAEDGMLSKNPIEHGPADSAIGLTGKYASGEEKIIHYWVACGISIDEALAENSYVLGKTPDHLIKTTSDYWHAWVHKRDFTFHGLSEDIIVLFKKSLLIVRAHTGHNGSIIASSDSSMLQDGKDTYCYVWPRDAAFTALALTEAGHVNVSKRFFEFCNEVIASDGYFMHKYSPDKSLGSSWHPWAYEDKYQLPIQEDETAIVLFSLWKFYEVSKDLEFIEDVYNSLIDKSARFLMQFIDKDKGLPLPSYDLWEERFGTSTFTACAVYGGLKSAASFAKLLGKVKSEREFATRAEEIKRGILSHLYDKESGTFIKMISNIGDKENRDMEVDVSSIFGVYFFGVLSPYDDIVKGALEKTEDLLTSKTQGGIQRYIGDMYYSQEEHTKSSGNPWLITTLWVAQYYCLVAKNEGELDKVKEYLKWVTEHALSSGVLSEQISAKDGTPLSAAPLVWSHSTFIYTVIQYLNALSRLNICEICNPVSRNF